MACADGNSKTDSLRAWSQLLHPSSEQVDISHSLALVKGMKEEHCTCLFSFILSPLPFTLSLSVTHTHTHERDSVFNLLPSSKAAVRRSMSRSTLIPIGTGPFKPPQKHKRESGQTLLSHSFPFIHAV